MSWSVDYREKGTESAATRVIRETGEWYLRSLFPLTAYEIVVRFSEDAKEAPEWEKATAYLSDEKGDIGILIFEDGYSILNEIAT